MTLFFDIRICESSSPLVFFLQKNITRRHFNRMIERISFPKFSLKKKFDEERNDDATFHWQYFMILFIASLLQNTFWSVFYILVRIHLPFYINIKTFIKSETISKLQDYRFERWNVVNSYILCRNNTEVSLYYFSFL